MEPVYTCREIAAIEKVTPAVISEKCKKGQYPGAYKTAGAGGSWRIPVSALEAYRAQKYRRKHPQPYEGIAPLGERSKRRRQLEKEKAFPLCA